MKMEGLHYFIQALNDAPIIVIREAQMLQCCKALLTTCPQHPFCVWVYASKHQ